MTDERPVMIVLDAVTGVCEEDYPTAQLLMHDVTVRAWPTLLQPNTLLVVPETLENVPTHADIWVTCGPDAPNDPGIDAALWVHVGCRPVTGDFRWNVDAFVDTGGLEVDRTKADGSQFPAVVMPLDAIKDLLRVSRSPWKLEAFRLWKNDDCLAGRTHLIQHLAECGRRGEEDFHGFETLVQWETLLEYLDDPATYQKFYGDIIEDGLTGDTSELPRTQFSISRVQEMAAALQRPVSVLEVGCHKGDILIPVAKACGPYMTAVGADIAEKALRLGRESAEAAGVPEGTLTFAYADAQSLPFDDKSFDIVMLHQILEHVPDMEKAVAEAERVCRFEVVVSVPYGGVSERGRTTHNTVGAAHVRHIELPAWLSERAGVCFNSPWPSELWPQGVMCGDYIGAYRVDGMSLVLDDPQDPAQLPEDLSHIAPYSDQVSGIPDLYDLGIRLANILPENAVFVEVGTRRGGSALVWLEAIKNSQKTNRWLFTIDPYGDKPYKSGADTVIMDYGEDHYREAMRVLSETASIHRLNHCHYRMTSEDYAMFGSIPDFWYRGESYEYWYGLVFLDGDHHPTTVTEELAQFAWGLHPQGAILVDNLALLDIPGFGLSGLLREHGDVQGDRVLLTRGAASKVLKELGIEVCDDEDTDGDA